MRSKKRLASSSPYSNLPTLSESSDCQISSELSKKKTVFDRLSAKPEPRVLFEPVSIAKDDPVLKKLKMDFESIVLLITRTRTSK